MHSKDYYSILVKDEAVLILTEQSFWILVMMVFITRSAISSVITGAGE